MSVWVQGVLNKDGFNLELDGKLGTQSKKAIKAFQKRYGLKVDGIVGQQTTKKLQEVARRKFFRREFDKNTTYFIYPKSDVKIIDIVDSIGKFETVKSMWNRTKASTVSNGGLYNMKDGTSVHFHVDEGVQQGYNSVVPFAFCIFNDETMRFQPVHKMPVNLKDAIGFSPSLVFEGKKYINSVGLDSGFLRNLHPRHAFMETKDYYIEVFVRGRTPIWTGCTVEKLADICIEIGSMYGGCLNAGNLDGGGSTSLVLEGVDVIQGYTRAVDNGIAIFMKD